MGKKRSSKAKKAVRRRAAQDNRNAALHAEDDFLLEIYDEVHDRFYKEFPTVPDAVRAALAGQEVEVRNSLDHSRRRIVADGGSVVIQDTVYPCWGIQFLLSTSWLNHPAPEQSVPALTDFLMSIVPESVPRQGVSIVVQDRGDTPPAFAYQYSFPADVTTWEEHEERSAAFDGLWDDSEEVTAEHYAYLQNRGVPAQRCRQCNEPVTNRHPLFPGAWVALCEGSPTCANAEYVGDRDDVFSTALQGPHRVG